MFIQCWAIVRQHRINVCDFNPMLFWCWTAVCDGGPASKQHRVNIWSWLGHVLVTLRCHVHGCHGRDGRWSRYRDRIPLLCARGGPGNLGVGGGVLHREYLGSRRSTRWTITDLESRPGQPPAIPIRVPPPAIPSRHLDLNNAITPDHKGVNMPLKCHSPDK